MKNKFSLLILSILFISCAKTEVPDVIPPVVNPSSPTFASLNKSSGKAGDIVIISGTGYSTTAAENEVLFKGTTSPATIKGATATTITVEVPANAITGQITIKVKSISATLIPSFDGIFTVTSTPGTGEAGTLLLRDNLKTHSDFMANDGEGNLFTLNTIGSSHDYYKLIRVNSTGEITKIFQPVDFGGTAGTNLRINGITNDFDGNVYVVVDFSTFRYTRAEGRLYSIAKGSDQPVFVRNIIGKELSGLDVSDYFDDMVINSKKELFISDLRQIYYVPLSGVITPYIDHLNSLQSQKLLIFTGMTIDKSDNIYFTAVNDALKLNNIYKVTPTKTITNLYTATEFGFADGNLPSAKFDALTFLAVDGAGKSLYLADSRNFRVRKLDLTSNLVTTVAGSGGPLGLVIVNGSFTLNANGPALTSTTHPFKLSLSEKQKTLYIQHFNDSYYQLYKY